MTDSRTSMRNAVALFAPLSILIALDTSAHTPNGLPDGFTAAFAHPFTGMDHLLAAIGLGVFAAQFAGSRLAVGTALLVSMLVGISAAQAQFEVAFVEQALALTVIVLAIAIAMRGYRGAPATGDWTAAVAAAGLAMVIGAVHGFAHGSELPAAGVSGAAGFGLSFATGVLFVLGSTIGGWVRATRRSFALGAMGMVQAGAGLYLLFAIA